MKALGATRSMSLEAQAETSLERRNEAAQGFKRQIPSFATFLDLDLGLGIRGP